MGKYGNIIEEENVSKFEEILMKEYDVNNVIDESVNFPIEIDNYLNISEISNELQNVDVNILQPNKITYFNTPVRVMLKIKIYLKNQILLKHLNQ